MRHPNIVEFSVVGDYALFSDPITRVGGEKMYISDSDIRSAEGNFIFRILETDDSLVY